MLYAVGGYIMKEKIQESFDNPIFILAGTIIGSVAGGILGVIAYYGQWLG